MKLGTGPYKGVRDFYPEDAKIQNHIFKIWHDTAHKYGYEEYNASVLEPSELYTEKSGEEIVNEQTYTFKDRGDRSVTLRPEMTPTVARMVAGRRRELSFPLRWYSVPNLFRYEQPQRGRLREHWQLNVDIFGVESHFAEVEVINMAVDIVKAYGLKEKAFEVRLNSRLLMDYVTRDVFSFDEEKSIKLRRLIDKKAKIEEKKFEELLLDIIGEEVQFKKFLTLLNSKNFEEFCSHLNQTKGEHKGLSEIAETITALENLGIKNVRFDQTLMRGFDYYTGIVFELFDKNPENRRAICGGGRYNDLLSLFDNEKIPAVGFGMGDVVSRDLMETYGTLPKTEDMGNLDVYIGILGTDTVDEHAKLTAYATELAQTLRNDGTTTTVDYSSKKIGDQVKNADRKHARFFITIGSEELKTGDIPLKDMRKRSEKKVPETELVSTLRADLGR